MGRPLFSPDIISVIVSGSCNLKCQMCDFWKDNKNNPPLSADAYKNFFSDVADCGVKKVQFTGGEPLLNKEIYDLLPQAKNCGLSVMMVTNGTLITDKNADFLVRNLDTIYISIDAPNRQQHDKIRGVEGAFQRTTAGIRLLVKARAENSAQTRIIAVSTIVPEGIHDPADMLRLAKELGLDWVVYNPASSVNYGNTRLKNQFSEENTFADSYGEMIKKSLKSWKSHPAVLEAIHFILSAQKNFYEEIKSLSISPVMGAGIMGQFYH